MLLCQTISSPDDTIVTPEKLRDQAEQKTIIQKWAGGRGIEKSGDSALVQQAQAAAAAQQRQLMGTAGYGGGGAYAEQAMLSPVYGGGAIAVAASPMGHHGFPASGTTTCNPAYPSMPGTGVWPVAGQALAAADMDLRMYKQYAEGHV